MKGWSRQVRDQMGQKIAYDPQPCVALRHPIPTLTQARDGNANDHQTPALDQFRKSERKFVGLGAMPRRWLSLSLF